MSKKCIKCGCDINETSTSDYCYNCEKEPSIIEAEKENSAKKTLYYIANTTLIVGLVAAIILLYAGMAQRGRYSEETELGISMMILSVPTAISSFIAWAVLKTMRNMAKNLREINKKTR